MAGDESLVDRVVKAALGSPKYRHVSPALVRAIARAEVVKGRGLKEAIKAVKNKLHQVAGAYVEGKGSTTSLPSVQWLAELRDASRSPNPNDLRNACRKIMAHHASTRERLPILDEFYHTIFAHLPPIRSIIDIACGLNPLVIPWMPLAPGTEYHAYDIYDDMMTFLGNAMPILGVQGIAETRDVLVQPPTMQADLALVLKAIPCLEQIDKSAGRHLLDSLNAKHMVVSFPVASLGGRKKGMAENYEAHFRELAEGKDWKVERIEFKTELVFLVSKGVQGYSPGGGLGCPPILPNSTPLSP